MRELDKLEETEHTTKIKEKHILERNERKEGQRNKYQGSTLHGIVSLITYIMVSGHHDNRREKLNGG